MTDPERVAIYDAILTDVLEPLNWFAAADKLEEGSKRVKWIGDFTYTVGLYRAQVCRYIPKMLKIAAPALMPMPPHRQGTRYFRAANGYTWQRSHHAAKELEFVDGQEPHVLPYTIWDRLPDFIRIHDGYKFYNTVSYANSALTAALHQFAYDALEIGDD